LFEIVGERKRPTRNLVELFDLIDGVEDFGPVHCFDVINAALWDTRHPFEVTFPAFLHGHRYSFNRSDSELSERLAQRSLRPFRRNRRKVREDG
jgi:hypothetical protein